MSVDNTDNRVNINKVLKRTLRNNVSEWIEHMVIGFPDKFRNEYSERHKAHQMFVKKPFVPEFLARLHGNNRDFCDKYALSWIAVTDVCKKVGDIG